MAYCTTYFFASYRLPTEGTGEAVSAAEVHQQAGPEEAGGTARPEGLPGKIYL